MAVYEDLESVGYAYAFGSGRRRAAHPQRLYCGPMVHQRKYSETEMESLTGFKSGDMGLDQRLTV